MNMKRALLSTVLLIVCMVLPFQASAEIYLDYQISNQSDPTIPGSLAAIVASDTTPKTVVLSSPADGETGLRTYYFKKGYTIPQYITLSVQNGARIKTAQQQLVINGSIVAGSYQIFESGASIRLKGELEARFEWFGAHSIDEGPEWVDFDSAPAFQNAVKSCKYVVGIPDSVYFIKSTIQITSFHTVDGRFSTFKGSSGLTMFMAKGQKNVTFQNFNVALNGAKCFAYVFGSHDINFKAGYLKEENDKTGYTFIDIHNSFHCFIDGLNIDGGGPTVDNESVGICVRSDPASGGFPVVDNIGISNSVIGYNWTNILLNFDNASNNIHFDNVSLIGVTMDDPRTHFGVRCVGVGRADYIFFDGLHCENMIEAFDFDNEAGYTLSIKGGRFSNVKQVFNFRNENPTNRIIMQLVDFRGELPECVIFGVLASNVTVFQNLPASATYSLGPLEGSGRILKLHPRMAAQLILK
jgi:hypothetical protein